MKTNKTVNYKGEKIKVKFEKTFSTINVLQEEEQCKRTGKYLKSRIVEIDYTFIINSKEYKVHSRYERDEKQSYRHTFEGFVFTQDNDKKIIEHIIAKYGI